jgi:outer membrane protein TolC
MTWAICSSGRSRSFVIGPLVGTLLSLPVFDGGARDAGVDQARAAYAEDGRQLPADRAECLP